MNISFIPAVTKSIMDKSWVCHKPASFVYSSPVLMDKRVPEPPANIIPFIVVLIFCPRRLYIAKAMIFLTIRYF
jgi:hypothetical protein